MILSYLRRPNHWLALSLLLVPSRLLAQQAEGTQPAPAPPEVSPAAPEKVASADSAAPAEVSAASVEVSAAPVEPKPSPDARKAPTEITVVGTRLSRTAGSAHVITRRQLERFSYSDPQAVVQQAPGVFIRQEDGIGLRPNIGIRGANPDRSKKVTLMEDGILFGPAPYTAPAAYYFPLMARMTGVRVIKGPAAVAYGPQTVGGAIDFITRPIPDKTSGGFSVGAGEYGYGNLHAHFGSSDGQVGFLVEGVRLWNSGFKHLPNGADTGSTRNDWMAKVSYVLDPAAANRNEFLLKLAYADEVSNESYLGLSDADFHDDPYQRYAASALDRMKNHRSSIVLSHTFETPARALKLKTTAYRHDYARVWRKVNRLGGAAIAGVLRQPDDPANADYLRVLRGTQDSATGSDTIWVGPNDRTFISQGVQTLLSFELEQGELSERLELGIRVHDDRIDRRHSEDAFSMQQGELIPTGAATVVTASNIQRSTAFAIHALGALKYRRLTLTPGARVELIHSVETDRLANSESGALVRALMPGAGLYFELSEQLGFLAGVYRGFSPPPPASSGATRPEYSVNYEAGLRYSQGARRAEVIGFYNDYSNLTDVCTFASGCLTTDLDRQFDAGRARIYGLEAYAADELRVSENVVVPLTFAYSLTRAQFRNSFTSQDPIYGDVRSGDEMPYVPRHQLRASLGVERRRVGFAALALSYVSAMREEAGSEPLSRVMSTDPQFWLDASGGFRVFGPVSVYGNARNLLNKAFIVSRRPYGARPNAPRWVEVGLKVEL